MNAFFIETVGLVYVEVVRVWHTIWSWEFCYSVEENVDLV